MTEFIDTEAGRQLLKEHFLEDTAFAINHENLIDPNFLEWMDESACNPLLHNIQNLYDCWKLSTSKGEFRDLVSMHLKNSKFATYKNLVDYCNAHIDPIENYTECIDNLPDELALSLRDTMYYLNDERTKYAEGFKVEYTKEYLDHLKSLVS